MILTSKIVKGIKNWKGVLMVHFFSHDEPRCLCGGGQPTHRLWQNDTTPLVLVKASSAVKQAGADFLAICTNTMHKVADVVAKKASLPLLHIVDVTGNAIRERGLRRIGLLGT